VLLLSLALVYHIPNPGSMIPHLFGGSQRIYFLTCWWIRFRSLDSDLASDRIDS
jgi:hypothetical protein